MYNFIISRFKVLYTYSAPSLQLLMMKLYIRNVWVTKELVDLYRSYPLIVIWDALVGQKFKHFYSHILLTTFKVTRSLAKEKKKIILIECIRLLLWDSGNLREF